MDKIEEELLKLDLVPEEVDYPELFLEKIRNAKTQEDWAEAWTMTHKLSITEQQTT